ncbi:MAG: DUF1707 domain-containing protein [Nocardiopsaceae bacterium]|jgi:hypothetical protein|nr:DUF1707 domain-containing protein [Nocardiopsaceae bacterium]
MTQTGNGGPDRAPASGTLASNVERETATHRLQAAFAEHRLTDEEFDQRVRQALVARTTTELDNLTADLPAAAPALLVATGSSSKPGRFAIALKSSISRVGRWTLPRTFTSIVYKGGGLLDLRAAQLTSQETTINALSYKSRTEILVPPGIRVELGGTGVSAAGDAWPGEPPADAPVVRIRGIAYKGAIEVRTAPAA